MCVFIYSVYFFYSVSFVTLKRKVLPKSALTEKGTIQAREKGKKKT